MREVNLSGIDLNLVPPLEALLRLRNITRAADAVGMSQPAMSRALSRLRAQFGDPLLIRGSRGLVLTPRGDALLRLMQPTRAALEDLFRQHAFEPGGIRRTVRFAASDIHTIMLAPPLMARLAELAPGVDVRMEAYAPDLGSRMETGGLDFAFALASTPLPPGAESMPLVTDQLALVMRRGHPLSGRPVGLADYASYPHAVVTILGDGQSALDTELAAQGLARRIALTTPHFTAALAAVAATDMLTTIARSFAQCLARSFDVELQVPPLAAPELPMTLVWSQVRGSDPFLIWMRELVAEAAIASMEPRTAA